MINLYELRDSRGRKLPAKHPIRRLLAELPWLHGLPSVRELFQLIVVLHRDRLTAAIELGLHDDGQAIDVRHELFFFDQTAKNVEIAGQATNAIERLSAARREIEDLNLRINARKMTERQLERLDLAVAELMRAVRLCRPNRPATRPRTYRDASIVHFGDCNVIAA